jgi:ubiquinone/menaquinone biosynthesis C-methylase UbiE
VDREKFRPASTSIVKKSSAEMFYTETQQNSDTHKEEVLMPIDFHAAENRYTYAQRQVDSAWKEMIQSIVEVEGKQVVDIGCGGGLYTAAFAELGAAEVTGVDFSLEMLKSAGEQCQHYSNVLFKQGNALQTGLPSEAYDIVLERAVTHHLKQADLPLCFAEALRLLRSGGTFIIQNRTPADYSLPGSRTHVRGYFHERYPHLQALEIGRRAESTLMIETLQQVGFQGIEERYLWEVKDVHVDIESLTRNLLQRKDRSILHELTDAELQDLTDYIAQQFRGHEGEIIDQTRWTLWIARKP